MRFPHGRDFVQRAASKPAAESVIDCRNAERNRGIALTSKGRGCLHSAELLAQPLEGSCRSFKTEIIWSG
jgi:hypothetical protein